MWICEYLDSLPNLRQSTQSAHPVKMAGEEVPGAVCLECSAGYASRQQGAAHADHACASTLLNGISDIRPGEGEVLQGTGETPEVRGIRNRWTISRQLGVGVHRSRARLALGHTRAV